MPYDWIVSTTTHVEQSVEGVIFVLCKLCGNGISVTCVYCPYCGIYQKGIPWKGWRRNDGMGTD